MLTLPSRNFLTGNVGGGTNSENSGHVIYKGVHPISNIKKEKV